MRHSFVLLAAALLVPTFAQARTITFEDRVEAQLQIERVYYAHRVAVTRPFERAISHELLERKVRDSLRRTVALERFWNTPITGAALRREVERIARNTRFPDRLREIYDALENDPFIVQETLARAVLVERLARSFFTRDARFNRPGTDWSSWWRSVAEGLDASAVRPVADRRAMLPVPRSDPGVPAESLLAGSPPPCTLQDLWGGGAPAGMPPDSGGRTVVWTGNEMIVWGGRTPGGTLLGAGGRYDPLTDTWAATTITDTPEARDRHTAVWTGTEMIIWGGFGLSDTTLETGGRYDPATDSWTPTTLVGAPQGRTSHSAVWTGTEMIIWGGNLLDTGGRYDPATDSWLATSTLNAPVGRTEQVAVWTGTEMIIWGGGFHTTGGRYDPVFDTWTPTSMVNVPGGRLDPSVVWTGTEMIIWGGTGGGFDPTGGRYDPASDIWMPTSLVNAPQNRWMHTAVWTGDAMIVWGGFSVSPDVDVPLDTGGLYDPSTDTWTATSTANAPSARDDHSAVWTGDRMIVWGSTSDGTGGRYDATSDSWTPTAIAGTPSARRLHTAVWTGLEMIVWGGAPSGLNATNTGQRFDLLLDSWTPTSTLGAPPARSAHTAVWTGSLMIVWGGSDGSSALDTGGRYDPAADSWEATDTIIAPGAREGHTAVWTGSRMIVWGGVGGTGFTYLTSGGRYDPDSDIWVQTSSLNNPSGRRGHSAVWTGSRMIVWGGRNQMNTFRNGRQYDPVSDVWTNTATTDAPSARSDQTAVWTGQQMIVWGGVAADNFNLLGSGGIYDPAGDTWTSTSTIGAPERRTGHTAVWTGSSMIVWGGLAQPEFLQPIQTHDTGGRFDPAFNDWAPTTLANVPPPRHEHAAVWAGAAMVIWGGSSFSADVQFLVEDETVPWYGSDSPVPPPDGDGDGFGACDGDCNDADPAIHPGATELCDGLDNDCDGLIDDVPSPAGSPAVVATSSGTDAALEWAALPGATSYDVVSGGLQTLRGAGGDFTAAISACLADDTASTSLTVTELPALGDGSWYLIRGGNCGGQGSYDSGGAAQAGSRDAEINASVSSCP